ncbi:MAG: transposase [Gemmatimonadaceae bacterium]
MRPSRFSADEIRQAIESVDAGTPLVAMCRTLGITQTTFYRWRAKFGVPTSQTREELHQLRDENGRLKLLVGELALEARTLRLVVARSARTPAALDE